jgi:2-oxoglutarate ferredoxin oxidoreductase subunit beta
MNNKSFTNRVSDNILDLKSKVKELASYETNEKFTWCGGCGNYGIINSLTDALVLEDIPNNKVTMCFDVGCNGNASDKIVCNTIHGLHGRVISLASGAALANKDMKVVAMAGDGATFSEGINHLVHAVRNDYPFMFIHHNNENYGLTTGQASSTTRKGCKMNSSPFGVPSDSINTIDFVLSLKPSFVARTFSGDIDHMIKTFRQGLNHRGFAFVEVLQACPTYNKATPQKWYLDRVKYIEDKNGYDNSDIWQARKICQDIDEEIYIGVLYKDIDKKGFLDNIPNRIDKNTTLVEEVKSFDISKLLEGLK